jgi:hypothetical protein
MNIADKSCNKLIFRKRSVAVYSHVYIKHINALCGRNVESLNIKYGGT